MPDEEYNESRGLVHDPVGSRRGGQTPGVNERVGREAGFSLVEMIAVAAIIAVVSAISIPMVSQMLANFRLSGDTRSLSNAVALAKMRAASSFSRVRLYANLSAKTHHL